MNELDRARTAEQLARAEVAIAERKLARLREEVGALGKVVDEACRRLAHPHSSTKKLFDTRSLVNWFDRDIELGRRLRAAFNKVKGL